MDIGQYYLFLNPCYYNPFILPFDRRFMVNSSQKVAMVILVLVLMAGSVAMFFMMNILHEMNPDPHEESHDYTIGGTLYGEDCTGTGKSTYAPENSNTYVYSVKFSFKSENHSQDIRFALLFDKEEKLNPSLYHHIRDDTIDGKAVSVYEYSNDKVSYTLYIGDTCTMIRADAVGENFSITADIVRSE